MAYSVRRVEYFTTTVRDQPGAAFELLDMLAGLGINLLAFTAAANGRANTQLTLFPEDPLKLQSEARRDHMVLDGPHPAVMVQGDDEVGVLAHIHGTISRANVNVYTASGVAHRNGSFGYVIYVRPDAVDTVVSALAVEIP